MKLTDEQINLLLDKFVVSEEAGTWSEQRVEAHKRWIEWIEPKKMKTLSDDELKNKFLEYFREGAGRHPFNAIYRDRIIRDDVPDTKTFREVINYLLDESVPIKERVNGILDKSGIYHIDGMGKGLVTSFLMDLDPQKYATWNNKTNLGLEALGLSPEFVRGDNWGNKYEKIMEIMRHIRDINPELSFLEIDHFLHWVSATEEGKKTVMTFEVEETCANVSEAISQISEERKNLEFVMEKYLEEFIEINFDKIDFGTKLELYRDEQDEENYGRQYYTGHVGYIDLLAVDRDNEKFVVIELKKGKSSDQVIGQILRYMGWVKENLTINAYEKYGVRGIIISKEKDNNLEYAIKMLPNILNVLLYSVFFELKDPLRPAQ